MRHVLQQELWVCYLSCECYLCIPFQLADTPEISLRPHPEQELCTWYELYYINMHTECFCRCCCSVCWSTAAVAAAAACCCSSSCAGWQSCRFIDSDSSVLLVFILFLTYPLAVLAPLRPRFACILGNYGHARGQGGRQPAAAKPPSTHYSNTRAVAADLGSASPKRFKHNWF